MTCLVADAHTHPAAVNARAAAFLDRDGVINADHGYVGKVSNFNLLPGVIPALQLLIARGYALVIVTNQGGIAHGRYSEEDFHAVMQHLAELVAPHGIRFDAVMYCPHDTRGVVPGLATTCDCRKPKPGMLLTACEQLDVDLHASFMVGDKRNDVHAGRAAGVRRSYLVRSGQALSAEDETFADAVYPDLLQCVTAHLTLLQEADQ